MSSRRIRRSRHRTSSIPRRRRSPSRRTRRSRHRTSSISQRQYRGKHEPTAEEVEVEVEEKVSRFVQTSCITLINTLLDSSSQLPTEIDLQIKGRIRVTSHELITPEEFHTVDGVQHPTLWGITHDTMCKVVQFRMCIVGNETGGYGMYYTNGGQKPIAEWFRKQIESSVNKILKEKTEKYKWAWLASQIDFAKIPRLIVDLGVAYCTSGPIELTIKIQLDDDLRILGLGIWFQGIFEHEKFIRIEGNHKKVEQIFNLINDKRHENAVKKFINCKIRAQLATYLQKRLPSINDFIQCKTENKCKARYESIDPPHATYDCTKQYRDLETELKGQKRNLIPIFGRLLITGVETYGIT